MDLINFQPHRLNEDTRFWYYDMADGPFFDIDKTTVMLDATVYENIRKRHLDGTYTINGAIISPNDQTTIVTYRNGIPALSFLNSIRANADGETRMEVINHGHMLIRYANTSRTFCTHCLKFIIQDVPEDHLENCYIRYDSEALMPIDHYLNNEEDIHSWVIDEKFCQTCHRAIVDPLNHYNSVQHLLQFEKFRCLAASDFLWLTKTGLSNEPLEHANDMDLKFRIQATYIKRRIQKSYREYCKFTLPLEAKLHMSLDILINDKRENNNRFIPLRTKVIDFLRSAHFIARVAKGPFCQNHDSALDAAYYGPRWWGDDPIEGCYMYSFLSFTNLLSYFDQAGGSALSSAPENNWIPNPLEPAGIYDYENKASLCRECGKEHKRMIITDNDTLGRIIERVIRSL